MKIYVSVETWFAGGLVVTFTDEYGVEYRGALLKRTDEPPEFKGPDNELASPLAILHDHSYCRTKGKRAWKQVPPTVLLGWNSASPPPLTPQHTVCKRNGFVRNFERRAIVEADDNIVGDVSWPYLHNSRGERNAKFLARLKLKESQSDDDRTITVKRKVPPHRVKRPSERKPKKKLSRKSVLPAVVTCIDQILPTVSPSLIAQAQQCTVGVTKTVGITSPLCLPSDLTSSSQRNITGTSVTKLVRPFSISLQKIPLSHPPLLSTSSQCK